MSCQRDRDGMSFRAVAKSSNTFTKVGDILVSQRRGWHARENVPLVV
jgi:hypothetical protein